MDLLGEFGVGVSAVAALELAFLGWVWVRARRRAAARGLLADASRLGVRHRRGRVRSWA